MELWDIYDVNRQKTGRTMVRGESINEGDYHLVVHVCIFNSRGEMLIQQRQSFKESCPNMWDFSVGGSAIAGDTSQTAAQRETYEEIGLEIDLQSIRPHFSINFREGFDDFYLIERELDIKELKLQQEEVQEVKWATINEIFQLLDKGDFVPFHRSVVQLMFDCKNKFGALDIESNLIK